MIIKPVSDLRNYNEVLNDVTGQEPVFLTKNGRGSYVIMDMEMYNSIMEYKKKQAVDWLMAELEKADKCDKYYTLEELDKELGL